MTTYFVSTDGVDSTRRNGRSPDTAWASLAYAGQRVPAGKNTIEIGSGTFVATQSAYLKSGVTVVGAGRDQNGTQIVASRNWKIARTAKKGDFDPDEYLIVLNQDNNVTIRDLTLASDPRHRITGALHSKKSDNTTVRDVAVQDFRWAGFHFEQASGLKIYNNYLKNASVEKHGYSNGLIRTRFIKDSDFYHNTIVSTVGTGYGYKGGGHEDVRIHHNYYSGN